MTASKDVGRGGQGDTVGPRILLQPQGSWVERAACADADPEIFVPTAHPNNVFVINGYRRAAAYCDRCPVLAECHADGETNNLTGVWGGRLRLGGRRVIDLLEHLYDERWWRSWSMHRARA